MGEVEWLLNKGRGTEAEVGAADMAGGEGSREVFTVGMKRLFP